MIGPTAEVAAVFWGRLNTPPPSIDPTTMAINAISPSLCSPSVFAVSVALVDDVED
ncbi:hypothetical protein D3C76_1600480 [compost metagenome]